MKITSLLSCALMALTAASANAAFNLQITEMWMGNEPGSNLTADWVEITNFGDMPWVEATDGVLWFDDDSFDPTAADPMSGIASIAPGESVVYVNGDANDVTEFESVWGAGVAGVQIGIHDGSGLGQGGDGAGVFLTMAATPVVSDIIDAELYPDANANGGQSWDVVLGEFSTVGNATGAYQSFVANDESQYAIASPGSVVPEPTAAVLGAIALLAAGARRRG